MDLLARLRRTKLEAVWVVLGLVVAWATRFTAIKWLYAWLAAKAYGDYTPQHLEEAGTYNLLREIVGVFQDSFSAALVLATVAAPLALLARILARGRVREGKRDPLDRPRAWLAQHPWVTRALVALPGVAMALRFAAHALDWSSLSSLPYALIPLVGLTWIASRGLRAFIAPTMDEDATRAAEHVADDEIVFSAVAVTRETIATVGLFVLMPFIAVGSMVLLFPRGGDGAFVSVMMAYIAVAAGGTALFQRASRIAVGLDGVLVHGTSRTRFFAYRDLDSARLRGPNLELCKGTRVVLRLQLHGEDAARRDAILARITDKIAHAAARRGGAAEGFVGAASAEQITRAVAGAVDFRQPMLSRDALWAIVEGPTVDVEGRSAAATALVKTIDAGERARLRVAASLCAEPRMRIALEKLGAGLEDDDAAAEGAPGESPKIMALPSSPQ